MAKLERSPSEALYPVPVVLVSCSDKSGQRHNIITIAWCGIVCSNPPLISVAIRPSRYSHKLITETGDFAINIPAKNILDKVDACGIASGKTIDKFKEFSLTALPAKKISSPLIKECRVNIECKLKDIFKLGTHDLFIGEVLIVHVDEEIISKNGSIDYKKAAPFVYNQGEYWGLGHIIGSYGFSSKKIKA